MQSPSSRTAVVELEQLSRDVQPLSQARSAEHVGYLVSGRMSVQGKDGTEILVCPGQVFAAAPGHDAWVVGDEPCVALDFTPAEPDQK